MSVDVTERNGRTLVMVNSFSLSKEVASELKEAALEQINKGNIHFDVDLSRTEYIDSSGIGKLLFLNKKLMNLGGDLAVTNISGKLYEFMESLALHRVMNITSPRG